MSAENIQEIYRQIEVLIKKMDIPFFRKKIENGKDVQWLKNKLGAKNSGHANYKAVMDLLDRCI